MYCHIQVMLRSPSPQDTPQCACAGICALDLSAVSFEPFSEYAIVVFKAIERYSLYHHQLITSVPDSSPTAMPLSMYELDRSQVVNARSYITQRFPSIADVVHDAKMLIVPSHRSQSITIPGSFREETSALCLYKHQILKVACLCVRTCLPQFSHPRAISARCRA